MMLGPGHVPRVGQGEDSPALSALAECYQW